MQFRFYRYYVLNLAGVVILKYPEDGNRRKSDVKFGPNDRCRGVRILLKRRVYPPFWPDLNVY